MSIDEDMEPVRLSVVVLIVVLVYSYLSPLPDRRNSVLGG
jgi:hypothetical protein